ncbi:ABC transporter substrate-binding protein [Kitasatospora cheerisanensis]|uniref:Putative D,D-dipeptide-binding periplasmic protein DdpA n=1 Tax=Kitasatospora cheerisanensis KCTC 2395 TaxID=1348663 RepID=A0A066YJ97_9ACTN|nr:ABC transporter substrate-binding protein [Kitasatospora cheerisanensis]KDN81202.1 putative D,D-dipeptide-binding periplasmic protein DdpA [Kitasatospora cheerisanensis KCTC 2395]
MRWTRPSLAVIAAALLTTSCSAGAGSTGHAGGAASKDTSPLTAALGTEKDSAGPAPAVPGARPGGTVNVYNSVEFRHLDPQKVYAGATYNASLLWGRQLTQYQVVDGKAKLVGDLATDTGTSTDEGRTWTYRLKEGVAWEDGKPITSEDVKYGIERTFGKGYEVGPPYWPQWLTGEPNYEAARAKYAGPQAGGLAAIETPDARTLVFHFPQPQADVPYMAAQSSSSPVRRDKDTGTEYDRLPFATGPYRIVEHVQNTRMVLERNPAWKAETDPIRNQYPDRFVFTYGKEALNGNQEILSGRDGGANATTASDELSPELYQVTDTDPKAGELVVSGRRGAFVSQLVINNERVPDVEVRRALNLAYPRQQARQVQGGSRTGELASTLSSPALLDWQKYDLNPARPEGDPEAAKAALAKAKQAPGTLSYAYRNTPDGQRVAQVLVDGFGKAGITVVPKPIDPKAFLDEVHRADSPYDLFEETSSVDWPTPSTLIPFSFDGRAGSDINSARYRNPEVDREIDRINRIGEPRAKAKELYALEQTVMKDLPVLPLAYPTVNQLRGSNVGGAFIHPIYGAVGLTWLYLKS